MDKRDAENTLFTALSQLRLVVASVEKNLEDLEGEQCQYMDGLFFVLKDSAEKVSSVADFIKAQKRGVIEPEQRAHVPYKIASSMPK